MANNIEGKSLESLSIDVNQTVDLDQLQEERQFNYYYENIFGMEDMLLYRAVAEFYSGNFKNAA